MDRLKSMSVVIAVADEGSLSAAASKLAMPVATVSRGLAELEAALNTQLFTRSSRHLKLTDAGRSYVEACKRILEDVEGAERDVSGEYRTPSGDLAVTSPWGLGHMHLLPIACAFMAEHTAINLRLMLTDRIMRPMEDHIDAAIRIGPLADSSMIATRLGSVRIVLCASPEYVADRGRPEDPKDLIAHDCITIDDFGAPGSWKFLRQETIVAEPIRSRLTVNTSEAAVAAAIAGAGIAQVMGYKMEAARQAGSLVILLEEFEQPPLPVHVVYSGRKPMPLKLRAFLDWATPRLRAKLAQPPDPRKPRGA
ncbi:putative transcriptional regulator, LysR family [Aurantimonas manganoxydans SI85-9A1]|uniref:Putative transcriptional regulator, LysR family n=1 Tax=Aurantimonas manganoxydans (strain ATCC BAA-1229 / DSM 21871 / SI85-9A1) TaxID=287752 RepID=Q1YGQ4_AURMS|nr:LysR family transcriptional regulator [Aurantimonas manganoxydans]EAS49171.1 putative transcriptional regulator, LysR family [Aurantimonas manganoxydans SI85-9A1]